MPSNLKNMAPRIPIFLASSIFWRADSASLKLTNRVTNPARVEDATSNGGLGEGTYHVSVEEIPPTHVLVA